jgi:NAD(P)-dependent dehydrogenase (short-subunit alcohol dehydrogenase family)
MEGVLNMYPKESVFITGAGSGFGLATAQILAQNGHTVFAGIRNIHSKNKEVSKSLAGWGKDHGFDVNIVEIDVTKDNSVDAAIRKIVDSGKGLDVIVNNAGVMTSGQQEAFTTDQVRDLYEVNVFGPHRVSRAALPYLRKQGSGLIINITSIGGRFTLPFLGVYTGSKAALEFMTESQRYELSPFGVDVVSVEPGAYPTRLFDKGIAPDDTQRVEQYGELADLPQKMFENFLGDLFVGDNVPSPTDVGEAILELIETPAGQRPLRTIVSTQPSDGIEAINEAVAKQMKQFMESIGFEEYLQVQPQSIVPCCEHDANEPEPVASPES